jgi:hypothetical protein
MITKNDDMLALSDRSRTTKAPRRSTTWRSRSDALPLPSSSPASRWRGVPITQKNRFNFGTMADSQQAACSRLMMTGGAGNHGWSIVPLCRCSHTANDASDGDLSQGVRWAIVNDEPFEYAIQLGPHGDEFVKLLNGECLRAIQRAKYAARQQS